MADKTYEAGTLNLSVFGMSDSAVTSIQRTVKALDSLYSSIDKIQKINRPTGLVTLAKDLTDLKNATQNFDFSFAKQISGSTKHLEKLANLNWDKISDGAIRLNIAIQPVVQTLNSLGKVSSSAAVIKQTSNSINSLAKAINNLNNTQTVFAGDKLEIIFRRIATATNSVNAQNIENLGSAAKSLGSLSKISKLQDLDYDKIGKGFNNLTTAISPFVDKVKEAETSLNALYGILSKSSSKKIQGLLDGNNTSKSKGKSGLLNTAKWASVIYTARRLGTIVYNIVEAGSDYSETLNLWQTAMGGNLEQATEFVNKMNEAYGISEKTLMNAQAIFKNMLGSLGQITEQSAYLLSEGVTQMALDYASLYNVTFEQAFTKFQAALAGQVRPIRSVAGYDITENTIFQLYQSLGGQKTMRQLSRTEKQLLSIYAVFEQMDKSNALGDLSKTMGGFANQSRVAADNIGEIKTWLGVLLNYIINESEIMVTINAMLITAARYLKAVAVGLGAIQEFPQNPFEDVAEDANQASEAMDKLNGKLLDFDKFRTLKSPTEDNLSLDKTVLDALSNYNSILENSSLEARKISDQWLRSLGFTIDTNGQLQITDDKLNDIRNKIFSIINPLKDFDGEQNLVDLANALESVLDLVLSALPTIKLISSATRPVLSQTILLANQIVQLLDNLGMLEYIVAVLIGLKMASKIGDVAKGLNNVSKIINVINATSLPEFIAKIKASQTAMTLLNVAIVTGAVYAFYKAVKAFEDGDTAAGILALSIGVVLTGAFIALHKQGILQAASSLGKFVYQLIITNTISRGATLGILGLSAGFIALSAAAIGAFAIINSWGDMNRWQRIISVVGLATTAILGLALAMGAFHSAWSLGFAVAGIAAGIAMMVSAISSAKKESNIPVDFYAQGASDIMGGTMFVAGENGRTEAVYNGNNGKSNVANVKQMEQAFYNALTRHAQSNNGKIIVEAYLDGEKVYKNTTSHAKKDGKVWANA